MKNLSIFMLVLAMAFSIGASETSLTGDVNNDNSVNIADVTALIDYLLSGNASDINTQAADCNVDSQVNIADVTALIDYLLSGTWPQPVEPSEDYVDLGLSSGTQWATRNIGATNPEDYGDYFAWGETVPNKEYYWWNTTAWVEIHDGGQLYFTKYNTKSAEGFVDDKTELDPEDDAAYVNWGPEWRMPSREQIDELLYDCTWEWTQVNGVNGRLVTGPNGNTIFLPASGMRIEYDLDYVGENGYYWGRSMLFVPPIHYYPQHGTSIQFNEEYWEWQGGSRCIGFTVRAVRASQD